MNPDSVNHLKLQVLQKVYRNWSRRQHFISTNGFSFLLQRIILVGHILTNMSHYIRHYEKGL